MADETLRWRLLLRDGVSGPAKRARDSLRAYRQELRRAQQSAARDAARAQRDAARQAAANARRMQENTRLLAQGTRQGLGLLGGLAVGAAAALAGVVGSFAEMGLAAARGVVEIAAFRESSLAALETVMGSSDAAGRSFRNAMVMANQTPADTRDVIAQYQRFAVAGFAEREIAPLVAASADLGAAFGATASDSFALVTSQMRAAGKMDRGDLRQLLNSGVNTGEVLDSIARQMNIRGGNARATRQQVLSALGHGRVTGEVGIQAALDATRNRLDRGAALGTFARRQSETLTGALSNVQNAVFNLLAGMDFASIPGVVAFKNALLAITAALGDGAPAATMLRGAITGAANAAGNLFGRLFSVQNMTGAFDLVARALGSVGRFAAAAWPVVRAFVSAIGPGFMAGIAPLRSLFASLLSGGPPSERTMMLITIAARGIGNALGFAAGAVVTFTAGMGALAAGITAVWGTIGGLVAAGITSIRTMFTGIGTNIVDGIIAGITGGAARLGDAVRGMGRNAVQSARQALGIASPSRVFADVVGRQIPAGVEVGINRGASSLDSTVAGMVNPQAPRGGFGGIHVGGIVVHVHGGNTNQETGDAVVDALEERLADIFGALAETTA